MKPVLFVVLAIALAVELGWSNPVEIPLIRRQAANPDLDYWANAAVRLRQKYSADAVQRRQSSSDVPLINLVRHFREKRLLHIDRGPPS